MCLDIIIYFNTQLHRLTWWTRNHKEQPDLSDVELEKSVEKSSSVSETATNTEPDKEYKGDLMFTVRVVLMQDLKFIRVLIFLRNVSLDIQVLLGAFTCTPDSFELVY